MRGALPALACALIACSGNIGQPRAGADGTPYTPPGSTGSGPGSGAGGAGASPGGGGPGGQTPTPDEVGMEPGDPRIAQRIWRLTPAQFNAEVERLFGDGAPTVVIPDPAAEFGIANIAENGVIDLGNASTYADGARAIASWVVDQQGTASRCGADWGNDSCVDSFLAWCPESAFRRTLSAAEIDELRSLYDDLRADYDYDYAFAGIVRAILLSPDFLYRTELGDGSANMTGNEIANLLAFSITDTSPDDELLQAAESEDLTDPDVRETQARRLMAKSERTWQRFFWEWLTMTTLYSQGEEVGLDPNLVAQMEEEYRTFVREVVVTQHGTLRDVLSAPYSFMQPELAEHYGVDHPGSGLQRVELDPMQRGGILTQGAWLVSHGKKGRDNVVRRGMNIYKQAMCNNNLRPPDGVDVQAELAKLVGPDATVREIVDARGNAAACMGCHRMADPIGLVFESFASDGSSQTTYPDGRPVDTRIDVAGIGTFTQARPFAEALAGDLGFQLCFVQRYAHFLVGIDLGSPQMVAYTQQAHERFMEADTSLEELLVALVRHPAYIERRTESSP